MAARYGRNVGNLNDGGKEMANIHVFGLPRLLITKNQT